MPTFTTTTVTTTVTTALQECGSHVCDGNATCVESCGDYRGPAVDEPDCEDVRCRCNVGIPTCMRATA